MPAGGGEDTRSEPADETSSLALDLGSTYVKLGRQRAGRVLVQRRELAPELVGEGLVREADPEHLRAALIRLSGPQANPLVPLGIASQRSSFLLWDEDGTPLSPIVSWQDRRAESWCARHRSIEPEIVALTGLPLSPHYAGPKLAALLEENALLRRLVERGEARFGTLETWTAWLWSGGSVHRTDPTMAARTLLFDLETGGWSAELLHLLELPPLVLPRVAATDGEAEELSTGTLTCTISDQAAAALAVLGEDADAALVNLGTGTFVLRPIGAERRRAPGYLLGPLRARADGTTSYALEGTINAGGAVADRLAPEATPLPPRDPAPDAFVLPDAAGVGAPHWRADLSLEMSPAARALPAPDQRRAFLEGLAFRVRAILDDLFPDTPAGRVVVSGGLSREPFVAPALAAVLGRPVERVEQAETTLLGAARLAAGLEPRAPLLTDVVDPPPPRDRWLAAKYERWCAWRDEVLARPAR